MKHWYTGVALICLLCLSVLFFGCSLPENKPSASADAEIKPTEELTVAAAADLVLAFGEIEALYEKESGNRVTMIFSSSGTAREQIENGAPYDVYASANVNFVDDLIKKDKVIAETKTLYAIGRVGIATLKSSPLKVETVEELLDPAFKRIAIANPDHAPYGLAAKQSLESLSLWEKLKDRMVYGKDIQDTLTLLKSGNVEAAFISLSVVNTDEVRFTVLDSTLHQPLKQAMAVVKGSEHEKIAREFIAMVNGEAGREIMEKYGFVLPDGTD